MNKITKKHAPYSLIVLYLMGSILLGTVISFVLTKVGVPLEYANLAYYLVPPIAAIAGLAYINHRRDKRYMACAYYQVTKLPYGEMTRDKGRYGEYSMYQSLKAFEEDGARFLFNVNVPKHGEPKKTTEIDALMLHKKGIFVLESKNLTGIIVGEDTDRNWKQAYCYRNSTTVKQVNEFYNPVKQNSGHMYHLYKYLGHSKTYPKSVIAFSDKCNCHDVRGYRDNVLVTNYMSLKLSMNSLLETLPAVYTEAEITAMYDRLLPLVAPPAKNDAAKTISGTPRCAALFLSIVAALFHR